MSAPDVAACPPSAVAEFALVGRSNVGKSSLLNALAETKIARTSRTPGRTQMINLFEVERPSARFVLADLPGFGYARAPKAIAARLGRLVVEYVQERRPLIAVLLLVDIRRGVEREETDLAELVRDRSIELLVVATKIDKVPKAKQKPALAAVARALGVERETCFPTSTLHRSGVDVLQRRLEFLSADRPY